MVEVAAVKPFAISVGLADIKNHAVLKNMAFVKQSRLSVSPVNEAEWKAVCKLGGV